MNFAQAYAHFRGSKWFLLSLALFVGTWLLGNIWLHFDPGWGELNMCLSVEASLSVALLIMDSAKAEATQRRQLSYMVDLMEAIKDLLEEGIKRNG